METNIKIEKENPYEKAGIISKTFFGWIIKICYKGAKNSLKVSDLYKCVKEDDSETLASKLESLWQKELIKSEEKSKEPSLLFAICKMFLPSYVWLGLIAFLVSGVLRSFQPTILSLFIQQFSVTLGDNLDEKLIYGSCLLAMSIITAFIQYLLIFHFSLIGMRIRVACCSLIYRKILRLSTKSLRETAAGQVINLISNDVSRFDLVIQFLHFFWMMPFQLVLLTYLIWREVGVSSLAGIATMIIMTIPIQGIITKFASELRTKVAERTDTRIKLMNQLITGIQVIKMYVWEDALAKTVEKVRAREISSLTKFSYLRGVISSMSVFMERFVTYVTIICFVLLGNDLTADKVFSLASFFNILQFTTAIAFPLGLLLITESRVSINRLQQFLTSEEKQESKISFISGGGVTLEKVNAFWDQKQPVLSQINVKIPPGCLCAVIGQVGSGKSSFLQILLGELTDFNGNIEVGGTISYSAQDPWVFASTVRKNILFGQAYDKFRYKEVVDVCALKDDFKQFPYNDKTVVGEKGISLSGGQRARINLARAVYRKADIYLLDDPLSAVDTHVGKHLFEKCILKYLRHKTRILVTHQLQYLKKADLIIVLDNGNVEAIGTFDELSKSKLNFSKFLESATEDHEEHNQFERDALRSSIMSVISENWEEEQLERNKETLVELKKSPYILYAKYSSNIFGLLLLFLLVIAAQFFSSGCDYWTAYWTQQEELRRSLYVNGSNSSNSDPLSTETSLIIYSVFIFLSIFLLSIRSVLFYKLAMNASKRLHASIFGSLLRTPMKFFDTNPIGRILNRFSKDMGITDEILPRILLDALTIFMVMIGIVVNVSLSNIWMMIAGIVVGVVFYLVFRWYIAIARDIRQLEGITKSPVISHLTATFTGLTTIRATKNETILVKEFDQHQNTHTSAWFITVGCVSSFGLWLDLLSVIFICCVLYSFIFISQSGSVNNSLVGLAVQQSLILIGMLSFGVRQGAEVVSNMTAVERLLEYTELEDEQDSNNKNSYPIIEWPSQGAVVFKNLFLKYSEEKPPVLKDLSFTIEAGQKVGVVGRTGAGKSSLIAAIFRLSKIEGNVYIDGVDTQQIPLKLLRKNISIIPQEPVLFTETLRYNLDPFQEFDDTSLWSALEEVELKDSVPSLDVEVQESGINFSIGQRQLICLARALLRNNKILVLDEATANVDPKTDALIQKTIRSKFRNCTVLTIAHRLNTVIDSAKIMVMDDGCLVEFDHPYILLQNPNGFFYKLISQTGNMMEKQLYEKAKQCYEDKIVKNT